MKKILAGGSLALLAPFAVLAGGGGSATTDLSFFTEFFTQVGEIISILVPILIGLALLLFLWGLVKFIWNSDDEGARDEGKKMMLWGVIALFVIVSVWGLVALLNQLTGVSQGEQAEEVYVPTGAGGGGGPALP